MAIEDKRDFREETMLNASEFQSLKRISGKYGISKMAVLRMGLHYLDDKITREELMRDTGMYPEH